MLPPSFVVTAVSSFVPWTNELSVDLYGSSSLEASATLFQSDGPSSTFVLASVSISKPLPGRLTSGWLASAGNRAPTTATRTTSSAALSARLDGRSSGMDGIAQAPYSG